MAFLSQIFQDIDGAYSSKRTAFFIFVALFVALTAALLFKTVPAPALGVIQGTQDKLVDLIKWIGGFIMGEQATKFAGKRGTDV